MPVLKSIVCTEGGTLHGYAITADHIRQMARNYNPKRYPARFNLDHIKSLFPDSVFRCFSLIEKAEAVEVAEGPLKGKLALEVTAELDETEDADLIRLNRSGQKVFSSIEFYPEFPDLGEAYLSGVALTDSPAAQGTQRIELSTAMEQEHIRQTAPLETVMTVTAETEPAGNGTPSGDSIPGWGQKLLTAVKDKLGVGQKLSGAEVTALREAITLTAEKCGEALDTAQQTKQLTTTVNQQAQQLTTLRDEFDALKTQLSQQDSSATVRPLSAGHFAGEELCDY